MARRRRRNTATRRRRRRNPVTRIAVRNTRRRYSRRRANPRRRTHHRRRNPTMFGQHMSSVEMGKAVLGGLIGVAAAKLIPPMIPGGLTSSPAMKVLVTGAVAFGVGMLGNKAGGSVGAGLLFGGLMQTASIALNAFLPAANSIALAGMGDLVPGSFPMPQNPITAARLMPPQAVPAKSNGGGVGSYFGRAY